MTSNLSLALAHGRYLVVENLRIPIAVLSTAAFPAATLVFFVVPFAQTASPEASAIAIAQLAVFAVMCGYLFNFGIGAADDRERPWDPYLRTLPAPAWPRIAGRVLNGLVFAAMGVVPLLVIGGLTTSATATPLQLLLGLLALVVAGLPFLFGGLAIGYSMSVKAANAATQIAVSRSRSAVACCCRRGWCRSGCTTSPPRCPPAAPATWWCGPRSARRPTSPGWSCWRAGPC